jgi:hypothetical protein
MNKITFTLFSFILLSAATYGQTFQGTIKPGTQAQSFFIVLKPSANLTDKPGNFQLTLAVPTTVGARPTLSIIANRYSTYFNTADVIQTATYLTDYIFLVNLTASTQQNKVYTANVEDTVAEVLFTGNIGNAANLRMVQLPGGLATSGGGLENGQYNLYIEFVNAPADKTNQTAMFYSNTGGTVLNAPTGYNGYSSVSVGSGIVPLKWLSFSVEKQKGDALLKWEVANQVNNAYYVIEAGKDLQSLSSIGTVTAFENKNLYTFTDGGLSKRQGQYVYYTIKQVDKDGKFTYSEIKKISISGTDFSFGVITNPIRGRELKINLQSHNNSKGTLRIFDLYGKQVYLSNVTWTAGYSEQIIQLPELAKGSYVASLSAGTEQYQAKFVK